MAAKIVTFINEKGGVGKTSTCFNISWELSKMGNKVLIIDMDPQRANITYYSGCKKEENTKTMYHVLVENYPIRDTVIEVKENLYIIPATITTGGIESAKMSKIKAAMADIKDFYDYIMIDVSPTPTKAHAFALIAADSVLIPMQAHASNLESLMGVVESIIEIQDFANPDLKIAGLLLNDKDMRSNHSKDVWSEVNELAIKLKTTAFNSSIRHSASITAVSSEHKGVTDIDPNSNAAKDVRNVVNEFIERVG